MIIALGISCLEPVKATSSVPFFFASNRFTQSFLRPKRSDLACGVAGVFKVLSARGVEISSLEQFQFGVHAHLGVACSLVSLDSSHFMAKLS